ncbi:MAG TPA: homoserine kinase, partial [Candidatus Merdibacter merdipullorum]|nr:homoserine kinase [Candidatus Merdibacter merdipullorum]
GKALESGDEEMVRHACIDRMQEPYRSRLIPEYDEVKRLCMDLGALSFVISGSGSTMLAVCTADTGGKLCRQLSERFRSWQVLELKAAAEGGAFEIHE